MDGVKPKHYFDECWRQNFYFCLGWSEGDFTKYMARSFAHEPRELHSLAGATFWLESQGQTIILIWTRRKSGPRFYETLAHECVHAANRCLDVRGVFADYRNDEPLAYLVEVLVRKALGYIK